MNQSVMKHTFSEIEGTSIPRSKFDRSFTHKTTFDSGDLVPIFLDEMLPGDTATVRVNALGRLSTPIYPIMDNLYMDTFFFAVPYRLIWSNFQKFMGEQVDPGDSIDYTIPKRTSSVTLSEGSTADYFGIPTGVSISGFSILPFRAYALIWDEWFRDQNLQDSLVVDKGDTETISTGYSVGAAPKKRGKRHDYFTSCLPWPAKSTEVDLPLGTRADVHAVSDIGNPVLQIYSEYDSAWKGFDTSLNPAEESTLGGNTTGQLFADLSTATAATLNDLRDAVTIQQMYERDARGGTRYTEIVRSHFQVRSDDARLQRPEFLGGGTTPINITPVAQTSETLVGTPLATLSGVGTVNVSGHGFTKSFTEHCFVIGLANVRSDITYQQGLDRMWSRETRHDHYFPTFANLGEQSVLNKEIYMDGSANDDLVFGYQERWSEMRYKKSLITGAFRSNAATSLEAWHLSEDFSSLPTLGNTFIQDSSETMVDRAIATPSEPQIIFDAYFQYNHVRPMPRFSTPGLMRF